MQKGFVAVSVVLILISVIIAISITTTLLSIGEAQSGLALFKGEDNLAFTEGCAEDAMLKARSDPAFGDPIGTPVDITRPEGACVVTVNSKIVSSTVTWDVTVKSSTTDYKRTIEVVFNRADTGITLTSWKEI